MPLLQVRQYAPDDLKFVIEDITDGDPQKVGVMWCVSQGTEGGGGWVGGWGRGRLADVVQLVYHIGCLCRQLNTTPGICQHGRLFTLAAAAEAAAGCEDVSIFACSMQCCCSCR